MKTQLILKLVTTAFTCGLICNAAALAQNAQDAHAGGYRCTSNCLGVDENARDVVVVGSLREEADADPNDVYDNLEDRCEQKLHSMGYDSSGPVLAKRYAIHRTDEHYADGSTQFYRGWWVVGYASSWSSYDRTTFDLSVARDDARSACKYVASIRASTGLSYTGDIDYLP